MAFQLDTRIPLGAQVADVGGAIRQGQQIGGMFRQLQQQREEAPIRNRLLQQQAEAGDLSLQQAQENRVRAQREAALNEQNRVIGSIANTYSGIQKLVDSGKFEEAASALEANKDVLARSGVTNFEDTDFAINAFRSGDSEQILNAKRLGEQAIDIAKNRGIGKFGDDSTKTAGEREFESLTAGLSEEDAQNARRIKLGLDPRAVGSAAVTIAETGKTEDVAKSQAFIEGEKAASKETSKLSSQLKLKPEVEAAVVNAVGQARADLKQSEEKRSNELAFTVYESAIGNLASSLGETVTGPGAGFIPAITANAQMADASVAMMAPVLKQIFRGAGEGTFTDQDQKLLLGLVPNRNTLPEARVAQLAAIDSLVRAKLRAGQEPSVQQQEPVQQDNSFTSSSGITFTVE